MKFISLLISSLFLFSCQSNNWENRFYQEAVKAKKEGRTYDYLFYSSEIKRNGDQYIDKIEELELSNYNNNTHESSYEYHEPFLNKTKQSLVDVYVEQINIENKNFHEAFNLFLNHYTVVPSHLRFDFKIEFPSNYTPKKNDAYKINDGFDDSGFDDSGFDDAGGEETDRTMNHKNFINYKKSFNPDSHKINLYATNTCLYLILDYILDAYELELSHKNGAELIRPKFKHTNTPLVTKLKEPALTKYLEYVSAVVHPVVLKERTNTNIKLVYPNYYENFLPDLMDDEVRYFNYETWSYINAIPYDRIELEKAPKPEWTKLTKSQGSILYDSSFQSQLFSLTYSSEGNRLYYDLIIGGNNQRISQVTKDLIIQLPNKQFLLLKLR